MLFLLVTGVLVFGLTACGGASSGKSSISQTAAVRTRTAASLGTAPLGSYLKNDGDEDGDEKGRKEDDDTAFLESYGRNAGQPDRQAVTSLVKRYYAAAAAANGAVACSLLSSALVSGLLEGSKTRQGAGNACATVVSPLLAQQRERFAKDEVSTMTVIGVRVKHDIGLAVLGFRAEPVSQIVVKREGSAWKVDALFDSFMR